MVDGLAQGHIHSGLPLLEIPTQFDELSIDAIADKELEGIT